MYDRNNVLRLELNSSASSKRLRSWLRLGSIRTIWARVGRGGGSAQRDQHLRLVPGNGVIDPVANKTHAPLFSL
ncbi:hypothetical protein NKDENANG_00921 [Candidatus Entotheonellaceae bacterium PAL068K]